VAVDKWYPFFGIGPDGWINKGSEATINDFYGSNKLKRVAQVLDNTLGLPSRAKNVSGWPGNRGDGNYFISAVNRGLEPAALSDRSTKLRDNMLSVLRGLGEPNKYVEKAAPVQAARPKAYAFDKNNPEHVAAFDATSQREREIAMALAKDPKSQGVAEGAPIVVMPRADRLKKAEPPKQRYMGDIVPPTKPPSTEKRGVKGRPGQRPMPKYDEGMAEAAKKCPPATQDITVNLNNRQKAINEYGYGPLNPDLPNTKFWMKKVDEWNLDSMEEAQSSLCGNCAAFDIRQDTLDCIAQGIDSNSPEDAEGVIDAGDLGYCKFLKFKCASRRTCDAWVTGGPLVDKPVDENQGWAATYETNAQNFVGGMKAGYQARENQPVAEQDSDYIEEKWSAKYKSSINCADPKGFSQKAHCAGRKK
jgi:hypothetical protein